ncbi:MAG: glycosyltransferase family 39 protein [Acidobacteriota bacterium]|nr:glycosyltransferase family 39 protein [Acidobacteriota bacterium]
MSTRPAEAELPGSPEEGRPASRSAGAARALLLVWLVSAAYVIPFVDRGWIAHDDGTLAQSAERVLKGELPHRDYDEAYTGGLTAFHALAFRVLGTSLRSLRYAFLLAFLAFVPLVFAIARRALSPWLAAAVTFTCVAWTVPNYFASMPSWYNLFLAALGAWALLRHIESGRLSWIFLAGIASGLSVLVKIIGLYDVAAVLLFLAWREQTLQSSSTEALRAPRSVAFAALKTALAALFVLLLVLAFRTRTDAVDLLHFVVPGAAIAALLVFSEWRDGQGRFGRRVAGLARLVAPFAAGLVIPIGAFVARYAASGALPALWDGVFVRPQRQIATASLAFPDVWTLLAAAPFAALLAFPRLAAGRARRIALPVAVVVLGGLLALGGTLDGYRWIWNSARSLDVAAVLVGCWRLWRDDPPLGARRRQQIFLLVALAACIGLVQYPFSSPIYFCYALPFTVLAIAFLVASEPAPVGWLHACVLAFYLGFALLWLNPGYVFFLGGAPMRYHADGFLNLPRGGIRIGATEARAYNDLVAAVEEKSRGSEIFAGPEAPEVYFLCGKRNLTRILFEGVSGIRPGSKNTERLRPVFDRADVKVVVWNRSPEFTHGLWRVYREQLWARFPHSKEIGKYTVMWRD